MLNILAMLLYIGFSAFGLYKIKVAIEILSPEFMTGFFFYGLGFLIWMYILIRMPLSIAFPVAAGSLIIATQLTGYFLLDEKVSFVHSIGVFSIVLGIILISLRA